MPTQIPNPLVGSATGMRQPYQDRSADLPYLVVLEGPRKGEQIDVTYDVVVGRTHCDIIISDPELSRQHALIRPVPGGVEVADLGSLNGTWVDQQRITSPTIAPSGARVRVGATLVEVVAPALGPPADRPQ
jgi:pSer/pThr/pTyr-binding forkhead associated (FHA) protein